MGLPELLKTVPYTIAEAGRGSTSFVHPIDAKQQQRRKRLSESDINSTSSTAAQTSGVAPINGAVSRQRFIEPSVAYAAPPAMRRCARSCSTWRALLEAYGYLTCYSAASGAARQCKDIQTRHRLSLQQGDSQAAISNTASALRSEAPATRWRADGCFHIKTPRANKG